MRAVDTNVVLRYLLRDDERQSAIADQLLAADCYLTLTVILETVWVLESFFKLRRADIARLLIELLDFNSVHCEEIVLTRWALAQYLDGGDIADMLHLVEARGATQFVTFDRRLSKAAGENPPLAIEMLR